MAMELMLSQGKTGALSKGTGRSCRRLDIHDSSADIRAKDRYSLSVDDM